MATSPRLAAGHAGQPHGPMAAPAVPSAVNPQRVPSSDSVGDASPGSLASVVDTERAYVIEACLGELESS